MTRILHTADLHLSSDRPERWEALSAVVEVARERDVDALLVAGDLLDRDEDHAALRPRVREHFDALPAPVYLIPGNHDLGAYAPGQDWGGDVHLLLREPAQVAELDGLRLVGVPFPSEPASFRALRPRVLERVRPQGRQVLLLHGTLIEEGDPEIQAEAQDDEPGRYLPVHTDELAGLEVDYVALGHYHQHAVRRIGGVTVAYAGSPSPVGSHAWGPRTAALVDLDDGAEVEAVRLSVPYRDRLERWLTPFREEDELEELRGELEERADPLCSMRVRLDGILASLDEQSFRRAVESVREELEEGYAELAFDLQSVGLEAERAELFRTFRERLDRRAERAQKEGEPLEPELLHRALELAARALKG